jgi:hypothetical protein
VVSSACWQLGTSATTEVVKASTASKTRIVEQKYRIAKKNERMFGSENKT